MDSKDGFTHTGVMIIQQYKRIKQGTICCDQSDEEKDISFVRKCWKERPTSVIDGTSVLFENFMSVSNRGIQRKKAHCRYCIQNEFSYKDSIHSSSSSCFLSAANCAMI